jgi:hypothetical protein
MKRCTGKVGGEGCGTSVSSLDAPLSKNLHMFIQPRSCLNLVFLGFYEDFIV